MSTTEDGNGDDASPTHAVVLDYLPHGRSDDNRPQYQKEAVAYALTEDDFDPLSRLIRRCVTRDAKLEADARQGLLEQLDYWTERD